jgi:hypothetical protein
MLFLFQSQEPAAMPGFFMSSRPERPDFSFARFSRVGPRSGGTAATFDRNKNRWENHFLNIRQEFPFPPF